jgi:OMF family outer membrane factor
MVKSGYSTRFDLLRVQAQLDEAKAERIVAEDNMTLARRSLAEAMAETGDLRPLLGELPAPEASALPEKLTLDVNMRDDLVASQKRESASDKLAYSAIGMLLPKVSLFAEQDNYKFGNYDPAIIPSDRFQNAYSAGIALSWDIFDGGASFAKAKEAAWAAERDAQGVRASLLAAPEDFELWRRRFISNSALFAARKRSVEESEESVRLASVGLKAGARTSTEFLDAELELFRSRAGLIRAQADADEAWLRLELATGRML